MLYLVPTPIGNLKDITLRALEVLREADEVLAEDTRVASRLLMHHGIEKPLKAFHAHNEHRILQAVVEQLKSGTTLALITDAGTPGISDPGFLLVRACIESGIALSCLPGPTSFVPALVMSGFPTSSFYFAGFLPQKKGRQKRWKELVEFDELLILFESPHRLMKCLEEIREYFAEGTQIAVCREISKLHEEVHRGGAGELIDFFSSHSDKLRGEIVILIRNMN